MRPVAGAVPGCARRSGRAEPDRAGRLGRRKQARTAAEGRRREAEGQLRLLRNEDTDRTHSDFYTYRYFATEGFLPGLLASPGCRWPPTSRACGRRRQPSGRRLPAAAPVPGDQRVRARRADLPRGRPLRGHPHPAPAEFGRHRHGRHRRTPTAASRAATTTCAAAGLDVCENCGGTAGRAAVRAAAPADGVHPPPRTDLQRRGGTPPSGLRVGDLLPVHRPRSLARGAPTPRSRTATGGLLTVTYGDTATVRRHQRRPAPPQGPADRGFWLDTVKGNWLSEQGRRRHHASGRIAGRRRRRPQPSRRSSPTSRTPATSWSSGSTRPVADDVSRQPALRPGTRHRGRVPARGLRTGQRSPARRRRTRPDAVHRVGRGRRRRAAPPASTEPDALARVARAALEICHFDPDTGADLGRAPRVPGNAARRPATTACCPTATRPTTQLIDRHADPRPAAAARGSDRRVPAIDDEPPRPTQASELEAQCDSELERAFVDLLAQHELAPARRRPGNSVAPGTARPDFALPTDQHCRGVRRRPVHDARRQTRDDGRGAARRRSAGPCCASATTTTGRRRSREHPYVFGAGRAQATVAIRRLAPWSRPAAANGSCCPTAPTTSWSCGPSAAPTTTSPACSPPLEAVSPRIVPAARTPTTSATTAQRALLRNALRIGFRSTAGPVPLPGRDRRRAPRLPARAADDGAAPGHRAPADRRRRRHRQDHRGRADRRRAAGPGRRARGSRCCAPPRWPSSGRASCARSSASTPSSCCPARSPAWNADLDRRESLFERLPGHASCPPTSSSPHARRHEFLRTCPDLVIVDEAHTCVADSDGTGGSGRTQRYELVRDLAADPTRHLILVTATPHTGKDEAFRNLLGLLRPEPGHRRPGADSRPGALWPGTSCSAAARDIRQLPRRGHPVPHGPARPRTCPTRLDPGVPRRCSTTSSPTPAETVRDTTDGELHAAGPLVVRAGPAARAGLLPAGRGADPAHPGRDGRRRLPGGSRRHRPGHRCSTRPTTRRWRPSTPRPAPTPTPTSRPGNAESPPAASIRGAEAVELDGKPDREARRAGQGRQGAAGRRLQPDRVLPVHRHRRVRRRAPRRGVWARTSPWPRRHRHPAPRRTSRSHRRTRRRFRAGTSWSPPTACPKASTCRSTSTPSSTTTWPGTPPATSSARAASTASANGPTTVRAVTLYGRDNQIDGIVLDVLLRKHEAIRKATGVVGAGTRQQSEAVVEALMEGLLLRGRDAEQLGLDLDLEEKRDALHNQWESAAAAGTQHPDQVRPARHQTRGGGDRGQRDPRHPGHQHRRRRIRRPRAAGLAIDGDHRRLRIHRDARAPAPGAARRATARPQGPAALRRRAPGRPG